LVAGFVYSIALALKFSSGVGQGLRLALAGTVLFGVYVAFLALLPGIGGIIYAERTGARCWSCPGRQQRLADCNAATRVHHLLRCMSPQVAQTDRASLLRSPGPESWGQLTFQGGLRDLSAATESDPKAALAEVRPLRCSNAML